MRPSCCALMLVLMLPLSCRPWESANDEVERLAKGGKQNLPKLYKIAANSEAFMIGGAGLHAVCAIADMGPDGIPYLVDLLDVEGENRHNAVFGQLAFFSDSSCEPHTVLALLYSAVTTQPQQQSYKVTVLRTSLPSAEGFNASSTLSDLCIWWLRNSKKYPKQILARNLRKSKVLTAIVGEVEKNSLVAVKNKNLLDMTRVEIEKLMQTEESERYP